MVDDWWIIDGGRLLDDDWWMMIDGGRLLVDD